jgi:hypothetical protein
MRCITVLAVFLTLVTLVMTVAADEAYASNPEGFIEWALQQGGECDQQWNRLTGVTAIGAQKSTAAIEHRSAIRGSSHARSATATSGSQSVSSSGYIHKGTLPFIPLSTRNRNDATRGAQSLKHPAQAHLGIPYTHRRPMNSKVQRKSFIRGQKVFVRPRLKRFGRKSLTGRRRGGISRPAIRADRPKKFKW